MDSGAPGDAGSGSPDGGGAVFFTWNSLNPPTAHTLTAVAGAGSGPALSLYLADDSPSLFHWPSATPIFTDPNQARTVSLWASPGGGLFGAASQDLIACTGGCDNPANFSATNTSLDFRGVCGRDDQHVYAVGYGSGSVGTFYQWVPADGGWARISDNTGTLYNTACFAAPDGNIYVSAQSAVLRYDGQGGISTETIHFPAGVTLVSFYAVGGNGSDVFIAGQDDQIYARGSDGTWSQVLDYADGFNIYALPFAGANSGLAAGFGTPNHQVLVLTPQGWIADPHPPDIRVLAGWAAAPGEVYLAGVDTLGNGTGVLYRGLR